MGNLHRVKSFYSATAERTISHLAASCVRGLTSAMYPCQNAQNAKEYTIVAANIKQQIGNGTKSFARSCPKYLSTKSL